MTDQTVRPEVATYGLRRARWADDLGISVSQMLGVELGSRPLSIAQSNATGEPLVSNGRLGADLIRLSAGDGFVPHIHAGDHLLIVIGGEGTITVGGEVHPTRAGDVYMVEGHVPHAVGAITDHVVLAVGSPHRAIDAHDRMSPVDYEAVTTDIKQLHCRVCDETAAFPERLHDRGCIHCPCAACHPIRTVSGAHSASLIDEKDEMGRWNHPNLTNHGRFRLPRRSCS